MKTKIEKIGERTYSYGMMPPSEAIPVEVAIARLIGEPLFKALATGGATADKEKMFDMGGMVMGMMAARADADELLRTMNSVFKYVRVDVSGSGTAVPIQIDTHFQGRNKELWTVFIAALRVNFSDFFEGLSFDLAGIAAASKSSQ